MNGEGATAAPPSVSFSWTVGFGLVLAALGYVGPKFLGMSDDGWKRGEVTGKAQDGFREGRASARVDGGRAWP